MASKSKLVKIGIWGFGKVGKAGLEYFAQKNCEIQVLDKRKITQEEIACITKNIPGDIYPPITITEESKEKKEEFLEHNNIILASPGIDLRKYKKYKHKFITELDILQKEFCKPVISITGSVGKTTVTHILSHVLSHALSHKLKNKNNKKRIWTGGNIGTPILKLIQEKKNKNTINLAILEVSSYQLEYCKIFAPDIALWTNLYPNHLDRHGNLKNYFNAKLQIIKHQKEHQSALLPLEIFKYFKKFGYNLESIKSKLYFFSKNKPEKEKICELKKIKNIHALFYLNKNKNIIKLLLQDMSEITIGSITPEAPLTSFTFPENILLILSALNIFNITQGLSDVKIKKIDIKKIKPPSIEHRIEKIRTINHIDFYNDSKSTTMASTTAAVKKLANKPIILLLGGLSKGVDRTSLIKKIKKIKKSPIKIISFGAEAQILKNLCIQEKLPCKSCETLEHAIKLGFAWAKPHEQVLLSPSGSSFDLFKNFEERGAQFKNIVFQIEKKVNNIL